VELSKGQLAREIGVSVRSIIWWEKDKKSIALKNVVELVRLFETSLDGLVYTK